MCRIAASVHDDAGREHPASRGSLLSSIRERRDAPALLGLHAFRAAGAEVATHERHVVGSGRQAVEHPAFTAVNIVLGNLKTAIAGTYHAFDFAKYAHRYLAEVAYRLNRRFDLSTILNRLLRAAATTPPWPEPKLRLAESQG